MPIPKQPRLTVDVIIEMEGGVVLVERKFEPLGWAIPGGFVEWGETLETAAIREAKEETGLDVRLTALLHVYSDPARDPHRHTMTVVYIATADGEPVGGDDAAEAHYFPLDALPSPIVFDHAAIIDDYRQFRRGGARPAVTL